MLECFLRASVDTRERAKNFFLDGFDAQGKVSLPSQRDGPFTSGLPLPGAPLRPKINVGHADVHS